MSCSMHKKSHLLTKIGFTAEKKNREKLLPPASLKTQRTPQLNSLAGLNGAVKEMTGQEKDSTQRKNIIFRFAMAQDTGRPSIF